MAGSSIDDGSHYSWPVGNKMNRPEIESLFDKEYCNPDFHVKN